MRIGRLGRHHWSAIMDDHSRPSTSLAKRIDALVAASWTQMPGGFVALLEEVAFRRTLTGSAKLVSLPSVLTREANDLLARFTGLTVFPHLVSAGESSDELAGTAWELYVAGLIEPAEATTPAA